jgi:hypothetical protein
MCQHDESSALVINSGEVRLIEMVNGHPERDANRIKISISDVSSSTECLLMTMMTAPTSSLPKHKKSKKGEI